MTIQEVLCTDWDVNEIDVTVRDRESSMYIMRYRIGKNASAGIAATFDYRSECGVVYRDLGFKTLYMNRAIQFGELEKKPKGKEMCRGVQMEEIPREILELTVERMRPCNCGSLNGFHGYVFDCYVDMWSGIRGENKQMELGDLLI